MLGLASSEGLGITRLHLPLHTSVAVARFSPSVPDYQYAHSIFHYPIDNRVLEDFEGMDFPAARHWSSKPGMLDQQIGYTLKLGEELRSSPRTGLLLEMQRCFFTRGMTCS